MGTSESTPAAQEGKSESGERVLLNVYQPAEGAAGMPGFGVYHSGVVVYGTEYAFAGNSTPSTGVYSHRPRQQPAGSGDEGRWQFKETVDLGPCIHSRADIRAMIAHLSPIFKANTYHITSRNCNHFSEEFCQMLGVQFPSWVNRLANVGDSFKGLMGPSSTNTTPATGPIEVASRTEDTVNVLTPTCVNFANAGCLNESTSHPLAVFLTAKKGTYLESDADEQLLLFIPFNHPLKLMGLVLKISKAEIGKCPKKIRLWKNRRNMDFQDTGDTCTEEVEVGTADLNGPAHEGMVSILKPITFTKFLDVSFLTIFIASNCGGKETTRLDALELLGHARQGAGTGKVPVQQGAKPPL